MDVPNTVRPRVGFARFLILVSLIQIVLPGRELKAGTSLVIFGTSGTNVPAQATNIAVAHSGYYYSVVRTDGSAVLFSLSSTTNQYVQVLTNNPPFVSFLYPYDQPIALLANQDVQQVELISHAVAIYYNYSYNVNGGTKFYALDANGTIYSWNYSDGVHDDGIASSFSNIVSLAFSGTECLALKNDGTVLQWNSAMPGPPAGLSNVVGIAAGQYWALALREDGTITNWGSSTNVPTGLSNVIAISPTDEYGTAAIALKSDGTLTYWAGTNVVNNFLGLTNVTATSEHIAIVDSEFPHRVVATNLGSKNGTFSLQVPSLSEKIYCLEFATNISNPVWSRLPLVAGNGGMLTLTDTNAVDSQRFYRVRKWQ